MHEERHHGKSKSELVKCGDSQHVFNITAHHWTEASRTVSAKEYILKPLDVLTRLEHLPTYLRHTASSLLLLLRLPVCLADICLAFSHAPSMPSRQTKSPKMCVYCWTACRAQRHRRPYRCLEPLLLLQNQHLRVVYAALRNPHPLQQPVARGDSTEDAKLLIRSRFLSADSISCCALRLRTLASMYL